jgi:hypothetical protein
VILVEIMAMICGLSLLMPHDTPFPGLMCITALADVSRGDLNSCFMCLATGSLRTKRQASQDHHGGRCAVGR